MSKRTAEDDGSPPAKRGKTVPSHIGVTVNQYITYMENQHEDASGELTNILMEIIVACKLIGSKINRAGISDILGKMRSRNVTGDQQAKLDVLSNEVMIERIMTMRNGYGVCAFVSEEEEGIIYPEERFKGGKYIVCSDPLDGSSNIDCNVPVGTIFGIWKRKTPSDGEIDPEVDVYQTGREQVASGYVLYGSSYMLVLTIGRGAGVHGFTLDPSIGEFVLSHENMRMPEKCKCFSVNEGNAVKWDQGVRDLVAWAKEDDKATNRPFTGRYVGSLVSDFHRNLLYGGLYCYPADVKNTKGKLRLLYEASPLAFIAEEAGGAASSGLEDILDIVPTGLHQKTPLYIGNTTETRVAEEFVQGKRSA